jgi:selenocysteine-specific elongation factor
MIIATAGHIDHGKTLLIRGLTGTNTDCLPEEKKRAMTIDLGFAYLPIKADRSIAFIDVPGHERFIRNMVCGAAGIDFVVFVVAADDGVMPQTREHLAILDLLGVCHGVVALTKVDRVDAARVAAVTAEIDALILPTTLAKAPTFPVSAVSGAGMEALQRHIVAAGNAWTPGSPHGQFRLAVDRSFHIKGAGIVATGTAFAGVARIGDALVLQLAGHSVRLRGLHANSRPAAQGQQGQRCALNIVGSDLAKDDVKRGDLIVAPSGAEAVQRLDTRFRVLASEKRNFKHWAPVHVHIGASAVTGRMALLEAKTLAPGAQGLAQLYLEHPIGACYGDRFIVRDQSAQRTIGGGHVIDIYPPSRGRAKPSRIAVLEAMDNSDSGAALAAMIGAETEGVDLTAFQHTRNFTLEEMDSLLRIPMKRVEMRHGARAFSIDRWQAIRKVALANVATWHAQAPTSLGLPEKKLLTSKDVRAPAEVSIAMASDLYAEGVLVKEGSLVRLPQHGAGQSAGDSTLWRQVCDALVGSGRVPPTVHDVARIVDADVRKVEKLLHSKARHREVIHISEKRFFSPATVRDLATVAAAVGGESPNGCFDVRAFRDRSGVGRNVAIDVLEYFDSIKFTRRVGDGRTVVSSIAVALGPDKDRDATNSELQGKESHPGGAPGLQIR